MKRALALIVLVSCGNAAPTNPRPLRAPTVTTGELDSKKLLGDLPARAVALGAGPVAIVASGAVSAGERVGAFIDIPDAACLLIYARASTSLEDIDIAVFADEGNTVAVDEAPDAHPTVLLCPPHPARVYAAVHAASGEGLVVLAAHVLEANRAAAAAIALHARGARGDAPAPEAWPGLAEKVAAHRSSVGGMFEEQRRVALAVDERAPTMTSMPIEPDQCTDAFVVGSEDVNLLDVEVTDDEARTIARAPSSAKELSIVVCSETAIRANLVIRPHVGTGAVAVVFAHTSKLRANEISAAAHVVWSPQALPLAKNRSNLDASLLPAGYGPPTTATSTNVALGHRTTTSLDAASGCRRVDVITGAPTAGLSVVVWDEKGTALTESSSSSAAATVIACSNTKLSIDVEARGRGGPLAIVTRKETWQSPIFSSFPVAASRMLSHAAQTTSGVMDGNAVAVRDIHLDANHRETWEEAIAPFACNTWTLGAQGDGTGVIVDALDSVTGEIIDRGAAARATSVRACSTATGRKIRIEARVTAGKVDAVIGERSRSAH